MLILSLSVGAATAVFSLLYALVLRPLPVPNPHELVRVSTFDRRGSDADLTWRHVSRARGEPASLLDDLIPSLDQVGVHARDGSRHRARRGRRRRREPLPGARRHTGARPADRSRRTWTVTVPTGAPVAGPGLEVLAAPLRRRSERRWTDIKVDGMPLTIIGVAPKDFLGFSITIDHDLWIPIGLLPTIMDSEIVDGPRHVALGQRRIGRLAPGVTMDCGTRADRRRCGPPVREAAMPDQFLNIAARGLPPHRTSRRLRAPPASSAACASRYTQPLYALLGIAGLVLLVAAANLSRWSSRAPKSRRHELAVRLALGAEPAGA